MKKKEAMLKKFEEFIKDSKFTEKDAIELGRKVNKKVYEKHYKTKT